MKPLFFTPQSQLKLMILPDTLAHLDGHTIITKTYHIFKDLGVSTKEVIEQRATEMHLEPVKDPNFLGQLQFDVPDKRFTYTGVVGQSLSTEEVHELISWLSHVRNNPEHWR